MTTPSSGATILLAVNAVDRRPWRHDADIAVITATCVPSLAELRFRRYQLLSRTVFVSEPREDGYVIALTPVRQRNTGIGPYLLPMVDGSEELLFNAVYADPTAVSELARRELVHVILNGAPALFEQGPLQELLDPLEIELDLRVGRVPLRWGVPPQDAGSDQ